MPEGVLRTGCILLVATGCLSDSDFKPAELFEEEVTTVYDVQLGLVPAGTEVTLDAVASTHAAPDGFFVQDEQGGPWSGVRVISDAYVQSADRVLVTGVVLDEDGHKSIEATAVEPYGTFVPTPAALEVDEDDWRRWEGVLVAIPDLEVESSQPGHAIFTNGLEMANTFVDFGPIPIAEVFDVTGVLGHDGSYQMHPRWETDIGYEYGGPSIALIQQGHIKGTVTLDAIVTSGPVANDTGFFIQDFGGGAWSGIFVYTGSGATSEVGQLITVTGEVGEFDEVTQIDVTNGDVTVLGLGSVAVTVPEEMPTDWEPWEGVLTGLNNVTITSDINEFGEADIDYAGITLDDFLYTYDVTNGETFGSITGVVNYSFGSFRLLPRDDDDFSSESLP